VPLFKKIDCLVIPVSDLETGLKFYRDTLGHGLIWRTNAAAGLKMPDTDAEVVLSTELKESETDILVDSADEAAEKIVSAGGSIIRSAFDIQIGRCAVVRDPFGNILTLLDMSKGPLKTDSHGIVIPN